MGRRKGLHFRRRKRIHTSAVQGTLIWIGECVLAFVIGCMLVYYFMSSMTCIGQAMEPSIGSGDQVLVNRFIYSLIPPKSGDVIVFKPNGNVNSHYYMRRVIGVPGDTVVIKEGFVYVNGELFETGIGNEQMDYAGLAEDEITLGKEEYFVLGDSRNDSEDSRNADIGNIRKKDIYGKAWFIRYPWDNFGLIP
ncbi:MAG: signal peptidase I [Clostridiales bacterium]|nr:signal peptidase I [Clostridiales bacterium]